MCKLILQGFGRAKALNAEGLTESPGNDDEPHPAPLPGLWVDSRESSGSLRSPHAKDTKREMAHLLSTSFPMSARKRRFTTTYDPKTANDDRVTVQIVTQIRRFDPFSVRSTTALLQRSFFTSCKMILKRGTQIHDKQLSLTECRHGTPGPSWRPQWRTPPLTRKSRNRNRVKIVPGLFRNVIKKDEVMLTHATPSVEPAKPVH